MKEPWGSLQASATSCFPYLEGTSQLFTITVFPFPTNPNPSSGPELGLRTQSVRGHSLPGSCKCSGLGSALTFSRMPSLSPIHPSLPGVPHCTHLQSNAIVTHRLVWLPPVHELLGVRRISSFFFYL